MSQDASLELLREKELRNIIDELVAFQIAFTLPDGLLTLSQLTEKESAALSDWLGSVATTGRQ